MSLISDCILVIPALPPVYQFVAILEGVLAKISRYDEGTLFSSFLSFTVSSRPLSVRQKKQMLLTISIFTTGGQRFTERQ